MTEPAPPGLPKVVVVGRPNVGKSTLFNRLAGRRSALVADQPGLTRDALEAPARLGGRDVLLVDTAGLEEAAPETLAGRMRAGAETAVAAAAVVLFVIDARAGIVPADAHFAAWLRRQGKTVLLIANKAEGRGGMAGSFDAFRLGLGAPLVVSAEHGQGIGALMGAIAGALPEAGVPVAAAGEKPLRLAIVGRPNAGKSTLINRLLGTERLLTGPEPGLTRDAVAVALEDAQGRIDLVDTAGLRRRARITGAVEKLAASAAIAALKHAELVALVVDASEGLHDQDLQLARLVEQEGRALVLVFNKWDAVSDPAAARRAIAARLEASLNQLKGIETVALSARTGRGVERFLPAVRRAAEVWNRRVPTGEINRWLEAALERHPPPLIAGRRLKLRYATQASARPPTFVLFGGRAERLPDSYQRYLVNSLRESFALSGTPIRIELRGTRNPYTERD
jgi:GTP-binding protein